MSRIKEAWLKVPWLGCAKDAKFEYRQHDPGFSWHIKTPPKGGDVAIWRLFSDSDLRTLADHGIVRIVEEEEQTCETCEFDGGALGVMFRVCRRSQGACKWTPKHPPASPVCPRCGKAILPTDFTLNGKRVWTCDCEEGK